MKEMEHTLRMHPWKRRQQCSSAKPPMEVVASEVVLSVNGGKGCWPLQSQSRWATCSPSLSLFPDPR